MQSMIPESNLRISRVWAAPKNFLNRNDKLKRFLNIKGLMIRKGSRFLQLDLQRTQACGLTI